MADSQKNEVLYSVFSILVDNISGKSKNEGFVAVQILLGKLKPDRPVVDFVVKRYMEIFKEKGENRLFANSGALDAATMAVEFGASPELIGEVIQEAAKMGWHGRLEDMARGLLNRGLTKPEVLWLVDAYVNDTATQGDSTEEHLIELARKYLKPQEARNVVLRLHDFRYAFQHDTVD